MPRLPWMLVVTLVTSTGHAAPAATLFERPVQRDGLHAQIAFGWAGGPTSNGLLHNMELGGTFAASGITLAYDHVWVLSDGLGKPAGGSDMFGGHMLLLKVPLLLRELELKAAVGLGENVDLSDGFDAEFGLGWLYGADLQFPLTPTSGLTLGLIAFHAITDNGGHQFAAGVLLGYTWF